ncbi:MAG TPA: alpha/beta hydrolase [Candidatus Baltobacteraceae bacterium]|nr:alpha/beta hydrolase [Candidatus Baltobacteraceae bacterium]
MPEITINGYVTHYEDDDFTDPWKPRQTIVIQHGFGRNSQFWRRWVPMLAGDYRVIRRDMRGHGGSGDPGPSDPWSFDGLVRDLGAFCDALDLENFHLLGESTGGMLAVGYAAKTPGHDPAGARLRSLTLCATPKTIGPAAQKLFSFGRASWQAALMEMGSEGWARELLSRPGTFPSSDPAQIEWAIKQFGRASAASLAGYSTVISTTDITPLLPRVKVPALILAPTRSAATSIEEQESIAAALPQSELVQIDGAGHEIYIDRAEDCVATLRDFLAGFQ